MKVKSESEVLSRVQLLETAWTAAYQAPSSMGFSRQEHWIGVPLPSPDKHVTECQKRRSIPEEKTEDQNSEIGTNFLKNIPYPASQDNAEAI